MGRFLARSCLNNMNRIYSWTAGAYYLVAVFALPHRNNYLQLIARSACKHISKLASLAQYPAIDRCIFISHFSFAILIWRNDMHPELLNQQNDWSKRGRKKQRKQNTHRSKRNQIQVAHWWCMRKTRYLPRAALMQCPCAACVTW